MSTAIAISAKRGFYERTVLNMLSRMNLGTLNLTLPSGEQITLGNGEGGVIANGEIKDPHFFKRCVLYGDIGFGEAFVDGDWDTDNVTNVIKWFLLNVDNAPSISGSSAQSFAVNILKIFNNIYHTKRENTLKGSKKNIAAHYDLNNDFFASFLDSTMTYSGAYFNKEGISLQEAQLAKYDRLCKEMNLKAGDHVLEIGSGWGGNAIYMAKNYGCYVTSVTISEEQCKLAKERVENEGLNDKVNIILQDYRYLKGQFDKIISIEMLEAVGAKFYDAYFKKCHELLKKDGVLALQVITCPDSRFESLRTGVDWIQKHIFPGSLLPSVASINRAINNTSDLTLVDLKDLGLDYGRTLNLWREQFNKNISDIKNLGFDDTFIRKWNYYFCYCEAAFDMRNINVMQMVYARPNNIKR
jgi:cyclopropane-fatty-acyl-phospholipid synthase